MGTPQLPQTCAPSAKAAPQLPQYIIIFPP